MVRLDREVMASTADLRTGRNTLGQWTGAQDIPDEMRRAELTELKPVVEINCSKQLHSGKRCDADHSVPLCKPV
jgi:hypothetical protein